MIHVLEWYYREVGWYVAQEMNIYQTRTYRERAVAPDIAIYSVVLTENERSALRSWTIAPPTAPAPVFVFEVASDVTWQKDINEKPEIYRRMGVSEYIYYDPRPVPSEPRLRGWHMLNNQWQPMHADERG